MEFRRVLFTHCLKHFIEFVLIEYSLGVFVAGRCICELGSFQNGDSHAKDGLLPHGQISVNFIEVLQFFRGIVDMVGEDGSVVLVDEVVVDDFEVAVRVDEYFFGVESN